MKYKIISSIVNINEIVIDEHINTKSNSWSIFSTEGSFDYDFFTARTKFGYWSVQFRKNNDAYKEKIKDFVNYENFQGRNVLIHTCQDHLLIDELLNGINIVNSRDSILVHSTGRQSWRKIKATNKLIANGFLSEKFVHIEEIKKYMTDEPIEYRNYVMLGKVTDNTEFIVASNHFGTFIADDRKIYYPGTRIYIDADKLEANKLIVRDGVHIAKVYKEINLGKYMIGSVSYFDFEDREWTIKEFIEESNNRILGRPTTAST